MRIAHIADIHFCRERAKEVFASLETLQNHIDKNPVDLIAVSGDIFDAAVINSGNTEFPDFIEAIKKLGNAAPLAMVYGTPSHDVDKSLDIFKSVNSSHGITILEPGQAYFLTDFARGLIDEADAINSATAFRGSYNPQAIIFGIPEPRKKYLLADTSAGKDETEEAIRAAMHKMCFLLAAKRREYPDIPCVVLYHGDVAGSVLQNDQTIERGTGISMTIDDLNDIDADYYALGHIHKPQQAGNLPAYYAGSIYPKNFGETHQSGFNVVELTQQGSCGFSADVSRVDFPHPQYMKIEVNMNDPKVDHAFFMKESMSEKVQGKRVWVEISCVKEERALINADGILKELFEQGAVEGSRITITDIPTETVRAAEITAVNTPAKKFEIWAENSNVEYEETILKKIEALESEITIGAIRAAGEWELVSVRLRGSIGIKKGIHRDEISIDFDNFASGLIALTGANGKGKTTLIENCHPYPQLLTRKGKLQDHFFLKDSIREVIYRNRADGSMRKFLIQIDGQNKSGSCKYFIFTQTEGFAGVEWEALPGVDGNLKPYEEVLNGIFGPMELYLRTAFITQRPTKNLPDLTDATAGEKKTLFVELAGIDYLQRFADAAAEKSKQEAEKNHDAEIKARMLQTAVSRKADEESTLHNAEESLKRIQNELAEVTEQGKAAKADVERSQEAFNAERSRQEKENEARKAVDRVQDEIDALDADKTRYQEFAKNKTGYEKEIAEYEALQKIVEAENAKKQQVLEANSAKQQEFIKERAIFDKKNFELQALKDGYDRNLEGARHHVSESIAAIKLYERDAQEITEICPTCGQQLPPEKLSELKSRRIVFSQKIEKEQAEIQKHYNRIDELLDKIEDLTEQAADLSLDEPVPVKLEQFSDTALRSATVKMGQINISQSRAGLAKAQEAAVRIEGLDQQMEDKLKALEEKRKEVFSLMADTRAGGINRVSKELEAAISRHAELIERYTAVKAEIARQEATIEAVRRVLTEIKAQEKELEDLKKQIFDSLCEGGAWDIIAKAFGKDGIQALELDALAPGISDTANRILESAYGDRFRIEIRTTRIGGVGKKTKQIEDFLIYVIDSEDGEAVLLDDKSGGEAVWIKRAIYDAFAVIRKRNANFAFLSCFQDEADGALDSAAKTAYISMLAASHQESKMRHTIIITHSNEVKAMIDQKIDLEELAAV